MAEEIKNGNNNTAEQQGRRLPPAARRSMAAAETKEAGNAPVESVKMPVVDEPVQIVDPVQNDEPEQPQVEVISPTEPVVEEQPKPERQKVKVTYENGKVKSVKKVLSKEEKRQRKIMKKGKRHYWWRYLLVFLTGIVFTLGAIAGTVVYAAAAMTTGQVVSLIGGKPEDYITEKYQDKTILEFVMEFANGEIQFNNLQGVRDVTPYIDVLIDAVNTELDNAIGFKFDKDELYAQGWDQIGTYIFTSLQSGIKLAKVLNVNESSSSVLIYLSYNQDGSGNIDWNSPRSLGDLMNNMDSIINNAKIGDLIDVGTSGLLYNLRDVKIGEMAEVMESRPLNQIIDIPDDAFPALIYIGSYPVSGLSDALDNAKLGDLLPIDEDSILYELRDKKISEISDEILNLKLGDVLEINESSSLTLKYLKDTPIKDLNNAISTMPLDAAIEINEESPKFLQTLKEKGATVANMTELIDDLTLSEMVDIGSSKVLQALSNSTLESLGSDVENLTLGDVVDTDSEDAPLILKALKNVKINDLGSAIHGLKIEEIIEIDEDSSMILKALKGTKFEDLESRISTLTLGDMFTDEEIADCIFLSAMGKDTVIEKFAERINELTFVSVFKDSIYEDPNDPSTLKSTWKYLLKDSTGTIREDYRIAFDMACLIENMERNFKNATLYELNADGFLPLDNPAILNKKIAGAEIGSLTMSELIEKVSLFATDY